MRMLEKFDEKVGRDGHAGVALWRRVADDLEHAIAVGTYAGGARLPAENQIAERFGVNRHTVRRALADLAARGFVRASRGSGTYVEAGRIAYPIGKRTRFSEIVGASGHEAKGELLEAANESASDELAETLGVKPGAPLVRLEILRSIDRIPVSVATSWVSADAMPDAARVYRETGSMTRTLAHFGIRDYGRRATRISAASAEAVDLAMLGLSPGRLVLIAESLDVAGGKPVLTTRARFAADRVELLIENEEAV